MFSGVGCFDLACQNLGMEIVAACEKDSFARDIYRQNFPRIKIWPDATDLDPNELPDFDLLCAGFPCQTFSVAGKRAGFDDPRGVLFLEIAKVARAKRPRYLLLENVQGILNFEDGEALREILRILDELHYDVEVCYHNTKDHLPQNRPRVFFVGVARAA